MKDTRSLQLKKGYKSDVDRKEKLMSKYDELVILKDRKGVKLMEDELDKVRYSFKLTIEVYANEFNMEFGQAQNELENYILPL